MKPSIRSVWRKIIWSMTMITAMLTTATNVMVVSASGAVTSPPQLNGQHFRIMGLVENGFLNIYPENGTFYGYLIDMIAAIANPNRANFTFELHSPSGYGTDCTPRLTAPSLNNSNNDSLPQPYDTIYQTQYKCGASDVNDGPNTTYVTDMYLGMYYITPARQLANQFTIPFQPPFGGTLAMFGTATGIADFDDLAKQQVGGKISPNVTCGPGGTALIESVANSFPGLQIRGIFGDENEIYQSFLNRSCQVYITDGPIAAHFVLDRYQNNECYDNIGSPIGVIGDPMQFGLSQYAIGIRQDIDPFVTNTISYWMNILMTCNPHDPEGPCPEGNLASFYDGRGGTGAECGYVLYPPGPPQGLSAGIVSAIVLCVLCFIIFLITLWHRYNLARQRRIYLRNSKLAYEQAEREREFNEYMAHEIRNPLSSAIAAISFVESKACDPNVVPNDENRSLLKADVNVIDSSLQYVNELLRNMLDLHRSGTGHEMKLCFTPTDILNDILEPISTILFTRGNAAVTIETICNPPNIMIMADRMRLKQICLNLAINASKFVQYGFIRLRAEVIIEDDDDDEEKGMKTESDNEQKPKQSNQGNNCNNSITNDDKTTDSNCTLNRHLYDKGNVVIYVEDSGPGIPDEKRKQLFAKFQDSLDVLNQGTGIGLSVCKKFSELMGAKLSLEDTYDSGVPNMKGTCFRLQMNQSPLIDRDNNNNQINNNDNHNNNSTNRLLNVSSSTIVYEDGTQDDKSLPDNIKVLFVDDDVMLRKMFTRVLKLAAPTWLLKEAANGETALKLVNTESFDIIFMDQYMASVEKQLLGTEAVRALRAKGVTSIICGLSANNVQDQFYDAGANAFMVKPFPCKKDAFQTELRRIIKQNYHHFKNTTASLPPEAAATITSSNVTSKSDS